jgi:transcriptional regulator with XRE-family HTH domain
MNSKDLQRSFLIWGHQLPWIRWDRADVEPLLDPRIKAWEPRGPTPGLLKSARQAQLLSLQTVAERLNLGREAVRQFERNETLGTITLESLAKVAEALDCELIVGIRPRSGVSFATQLWNRICHEAIRIYTRRVRGTIFRPNVLANLAGQLLKNSSYREQMDWSSLKGRKPEKSQWKA